MRSLITISLFLIPCFLSAQKNEFVFGKPSNEEIQFKTYEKDKSAGAVVLYDYTKVSFEYENSESKYIIEKQVRIKILSNAGIENGNVRIPFIGSNNFEDIEKIKGITINIKESGGNEISEINKSNIYKSKEKKSYSTVKIAFPNVKEGSIIDYKYKITRLALFSIPTVFIQQDIPVVKAIVVYDLPEFLDIKQDFVGLMKDKRKEEVTDKFLTFKSGGREQFRGISNTYEFNDIFPIKPEAFMYGSFRNYWKRIESTVVAILIPGEQPQYFKDTWGMVGGMMRGNKYFWGQVTKEVKIKELNDSIAKIKEETEKVKYIAHYVKNNFNWNQEYTLTSRDISKVAESKTGSNGDLNLLLVSLMRHAGLDAYPILCSTNDHGIINQANPDIDEFNYTMAMVQLKDNIFIIDATEKEEPYNLLPQKIMSANAYVLGNKSGRFIQIWDEDMQAKQQVAVNASFNENAKLEGTAYLKSFGYERAERLKKYKTDKKDFEKEYFGSNNNGYIYSEIETTNDEEESDVFEQKVLVKYQATQTGDYFYFNPNLLLQMGKNPFIADNRNTPINFQNKIFKKLFMKISLPEQLVVEGLPETKKFINSDTSIIVERKVTASENEIFYSLQFEIKTPIFQIQDYIQVKQIYKELYALLEEQIVLKKKK